MSIKPGTIVEFGKGGLRLFKSAPLIYDEYVMVYAGGNKAVFLEMLYLNIDQMAYFKLFFEGQILYFVEPEEQSFLSCVKIVDEVEK